MGVKVKLADKREVGSKKYKAGDVIDVSPGDARVLVAIGAGTRVDDTTAAAQEDVPADQPDAGDAHQTGAAGASAPTKPGPAGRKG